MTTLTTAGHPHTPSYITQGLPSCLVAVSARAYGSEGLGFGSLRAPPTVALTARYSEVDSIRRVVNEFVDETRCNGRDGEERSVTASTGASFTAEQQLACVPRKRAGSPEIVTGLSQVPCYTQPLRESSETIRAGQRNFRVIVGHRKPPRV